MDDTTLDKFLADCSQHLEERQSKMVRAFQFDRCDHFAVDMEQGQLVAKCRDQVVATAQVIPIATYEPNSHSWCWAWSSSALPAPRRQQALMLQGLAEKTGLQLFKAAQFTAARDLVWELTAMACEQLQAEGCYRLNQEHHYMMLALRDLKAVTPTV